MHTEYSVTMRVQACFTSRTPRIECHSIQYQFDFKTNWSQRFFRRNNSQLQHLRVKLNNIKCWLNGFKIERSLQLKHAITDDEGLAHDVTRYNSITCTQRIRKFRARWVTYFVMVYVGITSVIHLAVIRPTIVTAWVEQLNDRKLSFRQMALFSCHRL